VPRRHYIIYADESDRRGIRYSNFFGGVLLRSSDRQSINDILIQKKAQLGLIRELKWQYVDASNVDRYIAFMDEYFSFVSTGRLKVRIMFTDNNHIVSGLERRHFEQQYFLLYYQFIKHAFGIRYCNPNALDRVYFSVLPDRIPDSEEKTEEFRNYLSRATNSAVLKDRNIFIRRDEINDVDSSKHVILQGLDIILGSINSRLNGKLKEKPAGQRIRGKRTRAKERLYKSINQNIRNIYPNFNIGISTGTKGIMENRWHHPYRHWCFASKSND